MPETLGDLGESRIVEEVLGRRYGHLVNFGDDCASFALEGVHGCLVATTDPCPEPMAAMLGFTDLYFRGWLLATINLSDLAAAGAKPLGLLTSLNLPSSLPLGDFDRLLDGIDACCSAMGTSVVGGNLKEAPTIELSATAVGSVDGCPMSRRGGQVGDAVVVIGALGEFWAGSLTKRRFPDRELDPDGPLMRTVLTPTPKITAGVRLQRSGIVNACMDNSDGLGMTLAALASASHLGLTLDINDSLFGPEVLDASSELGVSPLRLSLGWGDWQLVALIDESRFDEVVRIASDSGEVAHLVGRTTGDVGELTINYLGKVDRLEYPRSERFASDSWFSAGIETYIQQLTEDRK